jgi:hypothetical protein
VFESIKVARKIIFCHCLVLINYMDIFWSKNSGWLHMTMSCLNSEDKKNSWQPMACLERLWLQQQTLWIGEAIPNTFLVNSRGVEAVLNWKAGAAKHGSFSPLLSALTLDSNWRYICANTFVPKKVVFFLFHYTYSCDADVEKVGPCMWSYMYHTA